jgi:hypothetical protein
MRCYHRTAKADAMLADGFKDGTGKYLTGGAEEFSGVWFSNVPLDCNDGAEGDVVLVVNLPARIFAKFEWVEDGKRHRESLIPATIVNRYGPPKVYDRAAAERALPYLQKKQATRKTHA